MIRKRIRKLYRNCKLKYRWWKNRRAWRRAAQAKRERIRLEKRAREYEEFPLRILVYELLRLVYMQTIRWWIP